MNADKIKAARSVMEAAHKRLGLKTQNGGGKAENDYALAAKRLSDLDPTFRLPRRKYRRTQ